MRTALLIVLASLALPAVAPADDYRAVAAKLWRERPVVLMARPCGMSADEVLRVIVEFHPPGSVRAVVIKPTPVLLVVGPPARIAETRELFNALDDLAKKQR